MKAQIEFGKLMIGERFVSPEGPIYIKRSTYEAYQENAPAIVIILPKNALVGKL